jgi:putative transposase
MALIISKTFDVDIDKDVVRRVLAKHYRPGPSGDSPSWRTFFGHLRDGLWSLVLHRCKSLLVKRPRILVVMAESTRRLVDLGVYVSDVGQIIVNRITELLAHLRHGNSDHQRGFEFGPRHASPPIPEVEELSPLPYLARSPPLANGSTDTPTRELNDTISSLTDNGLDPKLADSYAHSTDRVARLLVGGDISVITCGQATERKLDEVAIRSQTQCHGLNELPLAA